MSDNFTRQGELSAGTGILNGLMSNVWDTSISVIVQILNAKNITYIFCS
jgi:hypothetical protein